MPRYYLAILGIFLVLSLVLWNLFTTPVEDTYLSMEDLEATLNLGEVTMIYAKEFGLVGDGVTDDGPALQEAVQALKDAPKPAKLIFEPEAIYYLKTGPNTSDYLQALNRATWGATNAQKEIYESQGETYMIRLDSQIGITIDGNGATFVIDVTEGAMGLINLQNSKDITFQDFTVDYYPLPFADSLVVAKDKEANYIDVKVFDEFHMPPLGGPSEIHDEQPYFGMFWLEGHHSLLGHHYPLADLGEAYPGSVEDRIVRAFHDGSSDRLDMIDPGETVLSIPVRGIAHRGGREVFRIVSNENVTIGQVNVWSAPWFVFAARDNRGDVIFRDIQIRPKPGTKRYTSSWRDGIHITANPGNLLFERCYLEGMNDDAFNIKTHYSQVIDMDDPYTIRVSQVFPLSIVPWRTGDVFQAYSVEEKKLLGQGNIKEVLAYGDRMLFGILGPRSMVDASGMGETNWQYGNPQSPQFIIRLDQPIENLAKGDLVWNATSANPNTIIRDSKFYGSNRFQSSLTIEDSEITAFAWFHGGYLEGPIPSNVVIKNSLLRTGRGNPTQVLAFSSFSGTPSEPVISSILLQDNTIDGVILLRYAKEVVLEENRFMDTGRSELILGNISKVFLNNNWFGDEPLKLDHISFTDEATRIQTSIMEE